jgi:uncharacterized protein (TIGR03382 family)
MRLLPLVALALVVASAAPTALAARSNVALDAPDGPVGASAVLPVEVSLTLSDFMCHEPRQVAVALYANSTDGVKATWARTSVVFDVPAQAYFAESYTASQTVNLTVRAVKAGEAELTAVFQGAEVGPCFVPDGFDASATTLALDVSGPASAPSMSSNLTAPGNATAGNETGAGNATNATMETPKPASPRATGPSCGPEGNCGAIGDYQPPAESAERDAPGAGFLLGAAVLAVAALVARRRR